MPRRAALRALRTIDSRDAFSNVALDGAISGAELDPRDAGLATQLVYGVLERRAWLDAALNRYLAKPLRKLEPAARDVLRLGVYQLCFLDRVPTHAAVSETVKMARGKLGHRRGLFNAVLRKMAGDVETLRRDFAEAPLPLRTGWPAELLDEVAARWGERTQAYVDAVQAPPYLTLRVRRANDRDAVVRELPGAEGTLYSYAGVSVRGGQRVSDIDAVKRGVAVVQDEGAQLVGLLAAPDMGSTVLDYCAGRGGKAFHLADMMAGSGRVHVHDVDERKLDELEREATRLGIACITRGALPAEADLVLVDAPCTGLGVVRRHPERAWRFSPGGAEELEALQASLLREAADRVAPGGSLVYAVCSDRRSEGEGQIAAFLEADTRFEAVDALHVGPLSHACDGFYAARLIRS